MAFLEGKEIYMEQKLLSVVVPMYNEADNVEALYQELAGVLSRLIIFSSYEILFINDGSSDQTLLRAKAIATHDERVKIISFTRNFGHEQATYAGISHASGDAVVLIDADRQDPADLIIDFEREYAAGIHIVYGQRTQRLNESWLKKITSKAFYPLFRFLTRIDIPQDVGDFCMLSRKAVDAFMIMPEKTLFIRGLIYWSGLSKKAVPFIRRQRGAGVTKYNYSKLTIFALENIISFSTVPIYCIIFASLFVISMCILGVVAALSMRLLGYVVMTGWTSLIVCMLFLSATTLFCLGIIGLYIGKIFQEVKQRPIFLVDEYVNCSSKKGSSF